MFLASATAHGYEWQVDLAPTLTERTSALLPIRWIAVLGARWVEEFLRLAYAAWYSVGDSTGSSQLVASGILTGTQTRTGIVGVRVRALFTGVTLTATPCGAFTFSASDIQVYTKWGSEAESLWLSTGPYIYSGNVYDPRLNDVFVLHRSTVECDTAPAFVSVPGCGASMTSSALDGRLDGEAWWRRRVESPTPGPWEWRPIAFDPFSPPTLSPPIAGCAATQTCVAALPLLEVPNADSSEIKWRTRFRWRDIGASLGTQTCECPPPLTGQPGIWERWRIDREPLRSDEVRFEAKPTDGGLSITRRRGEAQRICTLSNFDPPTLSQSVITESLTYMPYVRAVREDTGFAQCSAQTQAQICADPGGGDPPPDGPPPSPSVVAYPGTLGKCFTENREICSYAASTQLAHDYVCEGGPPFAVDYGLDGRHVMAIADGTIRIRLYDRTYAITREIDTGIPSQAVRVAIDRDAGARQRVLLYSRKTTSIIRYVSTDGGVTWTAGGTVATAQTWAATIRLGGIECVYWLDGTTLYGRRWDRGGTPLESAFTVETGVDTGSWIDAATLPLRTGEDHIVLWFYKNGVLTRRTSPNGRDQWS